MYRSFNQWYEPRGKPSTQILRQRRRVLNQQGLSPKPTSVGDKNIWVLILLITFFACSSTPQKRSAGEFIDDAVISNKIKVKFVKDKVVKAFKINVDTWKGIVTLRGRVNTQEQISRALEIAERQPGVKTVKSYLVLTTSGAKKQKETSIIEEKDLTSSQESQKVSQKEIPNQPVKQEVIEPEVNNNLPEVTPQVTAE